MFRTDERQSLCDTLSAPDGYRLHSLLVMTYSLDFTALTAVLMGLGPQPGDAKPEVEPADVARALFGLKRRVVVFANNAFIHPGRVTKARRLFTLYDRFIVRVVTEGCAFHPKLWLAKYSRTTDGGSPRYRLVCSSRNLTTANTWECGVTLDGVPARNPGAIGTDIGRYIKALMRHAGYTGALARDMAKEVSGVRFEAPSEAWKLTFLGQGSSGASLCNELPSRGGKDGLLVAPFVTGPFLERLRPRYSRLRVISRQEELDKIAGCGAGASLKPWLEQNAFVVAPEAAAEGGRLDLHAKLVLSRSGRKGVAFVGSANLTAAAWGTRGPKGLKNWEAMIRLDGREVLSDFERHFMYEEGSKRQLRAWLQPYVCRPRTKDQEADDLLGSVQRWFSRVDLLVQWGRQSRDVRLRLTAVPAGWREALRDVNVSCAPYGLKDAEAGLKDMSPLFAREPLMFDAAAEERGEFVLVRVRHKARPARLCDFVIQAKVDAPDGWRDVRDQAVLKADVGAGALLALLLGMLTGRLEGVGDGTAGTRRPNSGSAAAIHTTEALLEPILRAWALDPGLFEDVRAALAGLGEELQDPDLRAAHRLIGSLAGLRAGRTQKGRS
jgi:hypothetical protein